MIQKIEPAAAIRLLDAKKAQAVDVREPDEYAVGHIPGAKLLPLGQVLTRAAEVLPDKNAVWLVYCRTGRRSADAAVDQPLGVFVRHDLLRAGQHVTQGQQLCAGDMPHGKFVWLPDIHGLRLACIQQADGFGRSDLLYHCLISMFR